MLLRFSLSAYSMSRYRLIRYFLLSLCSLVLITCGSQQSSVQPTTLAVGLSPWPGFAGLYAASAEDFYADASIDVKENFFQTASDVNTAFLADKLDLAWTGGPDAVILASQEPSVQVIMVSDYSNGADGILAHDVSEPQELKGKEVAWENLPLQALLLRKYLESGGLTEADVELRNITAADAAAAFAANRVDVAVTYEPWLSKAAAESQGEIIFSSENTNLIPGVLVAKEAFVEENREAIATYLQAVDRGVEFVRDNPQETAQIVADRLGVSPEEVPPMLETVRIFDVDDNKTIIFNPDHELNLMDSLEFAARVSQEMELIDAPVEAENLYTDTVVEAL